MFQGFIFKAQVFITSGNSGKYLIITSLEKLKGLHIFEICIKIIIFAFIILCFYQMLFRFFILVQFQEFFFNLNYGLKSFFQLQF